MNTQIQKTNDYNLFKLNKLNRTVNANHVSTLQNKISINDKSHLNPIIVNKDFEIVDGQHRFYALMKLNKPIHYVIDDNFSTSDLIEFNVDQKNWNNDDYLNYYVETGNIYYKEIKRFKNITNLKWHILLKLVIKQDSRNNNPMKTFKKGDITGLKDMKRAYEIAYILNSLESDYRSINLAILGSVCYLYDMHKNDIDFDLLIKKLHEQRDEEKLSPKTSVKEQIRYFDDVYNLRRKNRINFSAHYLLNKK